MHGWVSWYQDGKASSDVLSRLARGVIPGSLHAQQCTLLFLVPLSDRHVQLSMSRFLLLFWVPSDRTPGIDGVRSQQLRKENEEPRDIGWVAPTASMGGRGHTWRPNAWRGMVQRLWWWLALIQLATSRTSKAQPPNQVFGSKSSLVGLRSTGLVVDLGFAPCSSEREVGKRLRLSEGASESCVWRHFEPAATCLECTCSRATVSLPQCSSPGHRTVRVPME